MNRKIKDKNNKIIKNKKDNIRICTYNILAPSTAPPGSRHEVSCDRNCMKWEYRFNNIKKEILDVDPDIICLQEVQTNLVYTDIFPYFIKQGFYCYYIPQKSYIKDELTGKMVVSPQPDDTNFGNAIIFSTKRFYLLNISSIDYHSIVKKFLKKSKLTKFNDKAMKKFCGLVVNLRDKINNKILIVCTVHLEHHPKFEDIKNLQGYIIMKTLSKISNNNQHAVVLCGDFNSMPSSSLYSGITTGESKNKFDTQPIQYPKPFVKTPKTYSYYPLKSCYKKIFKKEPKFTNYTDVFKETLDYIFVNDKIKVIGSLEQVDDKYIKKYKSVPNLDFSSDHFMQASEIQI